jgi:hypothetical protein
MSNATRAGATVATITALGLLAGCSGSSTPTASPSAAAPSAATALPSASPSASATDSATKDNDPITVAALTKVALRDSDLTGSRLTPTGAVSDESRFSGDGKTFDYCGADEPSLTSRVGRYASSAEGTVSGRPVQLVEEIVQFEDASSAGQALTDFKAAVKNCDGGRHESFLGDSGPLTFEPGSDQSDTAGLPTPNYLQVSRLTGANNSGYLSALIVQQGRYLTVGYILSREEPQEPEGYSLGFVTVRVAKRVADLPA